MRRFAVLMLALALVGGCATTQTPPPVAAVAATVTPHFTTDKFVAADGEALPLRIWKPTAEPVRAVVVALHGFNDYSNAFATVGDRLAADGIKTYAYDQRGFGETKERGFWSGHALVTDAAGAVAAARARNPSVPVYLLGESMGGAVAILASAGRHPEADADGVILVAPAVWGRQTMNLAERAGLFVAKLFPGWTLSADLMPTVWPSDNIPMLRAYSADPLVIKDTRAEAITGLVDMMSAALDAAPRLDRPTLILYGERDQIIPRDPIIRMVDGLPQQTAEQSRMALYPDGYHMLMRDLDGPAVVDDVAAWIENPNGTLPSGADRNPALVAFRQTGAPSVASLPTAVAPAPRG